MKTVLLIALLALAGVVHAADAPDAGKPLDNLAPPAAKAPCDTAKPPMKPCDKPGMGPGMGMGMMGGMMGGMPRKDGPPCATGGGCDCPKHKAMSERVEQLEKRIDALQLAIEVMARK